MDVICSVVSAESGKYYCGDINGKPSMNNRIYRMVYPEYEKAKRKSNELSKNLGEKFEVVVEYQVFDSDKHQRTSAYVDTRIRKTIRCKKCLYPVLESDEKGYSYQCVMCDEDLFEFETREGPEATEYEVDKIKWKALELLGLED